MKQLFETLTIILAIGVLMVASLLIANGVIQF